MHEYDGAAEILQGGTRHAVSVEFESEGEETTGTLAWKGSYAAAGNAPWPTAGEATLLLPDGEQGAIVIADSETTSSWQQGSFAGVGEPPSAAI
jgi:hypothetical protein